MEGRHFSMQYAGIAAACSNCFSTMERIPVRLPKTYLIKRDVIGALCTYLPNKATTNLELVSDLLGAGIPVDGLENLDDESVSDVDTETPFYVAVRKNSFELADLLLFKGANINKLSSRSSLLISDHSLTGLGPIVALNARYCIPSIRYLLDSHAFLISGATPGAGITAESTSSATTNIPETLPNTVNFIVEPTRFLTALHFCAVVPYGLHYTAGNPLSEQISTLKLNL
jgi:hypothetical protein